MRLQSCLILSNVIKVINVIRTRVEGTIAERSYESSWQSDKTFCEMLW